jgi:magnesium chelatase family protein
LPLVKAPRDLKDLLRRDHTLNGGILYGIDGFIVEVQARAIKVAQRPISWGSSVGITGMARGAVSEAKSRIIGCFAKLAIPDPQVEILINLAPADLPKEGTWLDLPLAIIMLQAAGMLPDLPEHREGDYVLFGEIGIHGEVRRVPGALCLGYEARPGQQLIVPSGNEKECCLILAKPGHEGCGVYPVGLVEDVILFFLGKTKLENALKGGIKFEEAVTKAVDYGRIRGQARAKRATTITAAGGHNLLLIGPPGEGKSLLASALPGVLPRLTDGEKVLLTKVHSACGALEKDGTAVTRRPMRKIHHTASKAALIGGGSGVPRPGEITLSHLGVLFLDEFAEFGKGTLESLRQPIEDGEINISRARATLKFPCQFTLVAAMNPCPCGYYGTDQCRCDDRTVRGYQQKVSGPILDRIDLQVEMDRLSIDERFAETEDGVSRRIRAIVERARQMQHDRFDGTGIPFNAAIPGGHVTDYCRFSPPAFDTYKSMIEDSSLSTRSMDRLAKVSRTIADLGASEDIVPQHVQEAGSYVIGGMLRENYS